ncbi:hypothetical protein E2C01_092198 [Portunus trituberculatus]|uniref:Uncharacterized protein n=1 Tax=Portunus trituberculatus TaxID=210409 RepID=A0A5B7JUU7_PORTR|nr:hypothetical protein [Portunus trituberculatus]
MRAAGLSNTLDSHNNPQHRQLTSTTQADHILKHSCAEHPLLSKDNSSRSYMGFYGNAKSTIPFPISPRRVIPRRLLVLPRPARKKVSLKPVARSLRLNPEPLPASSPSRTLSNSVLHGLCSLATSTRPLLTLRPPSVTSNSSSPSDRSYPLLVTSHSLVLTPTSPVLPQ